MALFLPRHVANLGVSLSKKTAVKPKEYGANLIIDFRSQFVDLENPPQDASPVWYRKRGKDFERVMHNLLEDEDLQPRTSYRPQGEEIDGSFSLDNRFFLMEAKWHTKPLPASAIYQFKGKVDGKLIGTIGVFISMSGYSEDAVEAVRLGKTLNVILFDGDDFRACLCEDVGFGNVLRAKLRQAAQTGEIYFPYKSEIILNNARNDIVFVVEGYTDQIIISHFASRILEEQGLDRNIEFMVAMGKMGVANIANSIHLLSLNAKIILVADSDGDIEGTRNLLASRFESSESEVLIVHPCIEAWIFPGQGESLEHLREMMREKGIRKNRITEYLQDVNIEKLLAEDETFRRFVHLITE